MPTHKERPILFNGDMVRAILAGQKTQTRRIIKQMQFAPPCSPIPMWCFMTGKDSGMFYPNAKEQILKLAPLGQVGDRLWVRETWRGLVQINDPLHSPEYGIARYVPAQDQCRRVDYLATHGKDSEPWRPSIHMPRWASRITLEITGVRIEQLNQISEVDAEAEGIDFLRSAPDADETLTAKQLFSILWESIYDKGSFDHRFVWVYEFKQVEL
jgi:hypothetical protein